MAKLKLEANNPTEQRILDYLNEHASAVLEWKITMSKKTIAGALVYAKKEAQKLAKGESCACIEDEVVFGWVIHYFEEEAIKESLPAKRPPVKVPAGVKKKAAKPAKPSLENPVALDLFEDA